MKDMKQTDFYRGIVRAWFLKVELGILDQLNGNCSVKHNLAVVPFVSLFVYLSICLFICFFNGAIRKLYS